MDFRDMVTSHVRNTQLKTKGKKMSNTRVLDRTAKLQTTIIANSDARGLRCQKTMTLWGEKVYIRIVDSGNMTIGLETPQFRFVLKYNDRHCQITEHWIQDIDGPRRVWSDRRRNVMTETILDTLQQELGIRVS